MNRHGGLELRNLRERYRQQLFAQYHAVPLITQTARALGAFAALKRLRLRLIGAPKPP